MITSFKLSKDNYAQALVHVLALVSPSGKVLMIEGHTGEDDGKLTTVHLLHIQPFDTMAGDTGLQFTFAETAYDFPIAPVSLISVSHDRGIVMLQYPLSTVYRMFEALDL